MGNGRSYRSARRDICMRYSALWIAAIVIMIIISLQNSESEDIESLTHFTPHQLVSLGDVLVPTSKSSSAAASWKRDAPPLIIAHVTKELTPIAGFGGMGRAVSDIVGHVATRTVATGDAPPSLFVILPRYQFLEDLSKAAPSFKLPLNFDGSMHAVDVHLLSVPASLIARPGTSLPQSAREMQAMTATCLNQHTSAQLKELFATMDVQYPILTESGLKSGSTNQGGASTTAHSAGIVDGSGNTTSNTTISSSSSVNTNGDGSSRVCVYIMLINGHIEGLSEGAAGQFRTHYSIFSAATSPGRMYSVDPDIGYQLRDAYFGAAAGRLVQRLERTAQRLTQPMRMVAHIHGATNAVAVLPLKPKGMRHETPFTPLKGRDERDGGPDSGPDEGPESDLGPEPVEQGGDDVADQGPRVGSKAPRHLRDIPVVYTIHDISSDPGYPISVVDVARFGVPVPTGLVPWYEPSIQGSRLALVHTDVATFVSVHLAQRIANGDEQLPSSLIHALRSLVANKRWYGIPNGVALPSVSAGAASDPPAEVPSFTTKLAAKRFVLSEVYTASPQSRARYGHAVVSASNIVSPPPVHLRGASQRFSGASQLMNGVSAESLSSRLWVMFLGRYESNKGTDTFLTAADLVCARGDVLVLTGTHTAEVLPKQQLREVYMKYVRPGASAQCRGAVIILDTREQQQILLSGLRKAVDVALVPSIREGFGLVALEAMANGAAVVAARVGGLRDTVVPLTGLSGGLVEGSGTWTGEFFDRFDSNQRQLTPHHMYANVQRSIGNVLDRLSMMSKPQRDEHMAAIRRYIERFNWQSARRDGLVAQWRAAYEAAYVDVKANEDEGS